MQRIVISFLIGTLFLLSCSSNRSKYDFNYCVSLLDSIDLDSVKGLTDLSVRWRSGVLLFEIQNKVDAPSIPYYIKENNKQLILGGGKRWVYLDSLQIEKRTMLDSIYLQKDRIKYCYSLMNKYPLKRINHLAKRRTTVLEIDTFSFVNARDSSCFAYRNVELLKEDWWIHK